MARTAEKRAARRKRISRPRGLKSPKFTNKLIASQIQQAFRRLEAGGVLSGRADKVSVRVDHGLLAAAARKAGSSNTTEIMEAALAAFVAPDPFVVWFLSDKDRLPADFELAI